MSKHRRGSAHPIFLLSERVLGTVGVWIGWVKQRLVTWQGVAHIPVFLYHVGGAHYQVVPLYRAAPEYAEGFADEEVGCVAVVIGGSCFGVVVIVGGSSSTIAVASVVRVRAVRVIIVIVVAVVGHVRGINCITVILCIRRLGEVERHEYADGAEQGAEDKVGRVVQKRGLALQRAGLVDEGFGGCVALENVALEHLFTVAGEGHEVVGLDLEEGGEEDKVVEVCL